MEQAQSIFGLLVVFLQISAFNCTVISTTNSSLTSVPTTELQKVIALFTREKLSLQNYVTIQESKLNNKFNVLEQNLNATKAKLDKVTNGLNKEKHDREQLQQNYDQLIIDFYNVSVNYNSLLTKIQSDAARTTALETKDTEIERKNQDLENIVHNMSQSLRGIDLTTLRTDHADLLELKNKAGYNSGFTAWSPANGLISGTITFSQVISNIGGQYQSNTGKFYCRYPGVYSFSMAIYKNSYATLAYCYMRKNGSSVSYSSSSSSSSLSVGRISIIVHLNSGDVIDAGYCTGASTMSMYSSFTGFLIKAD